MEDIWLAQLQFSSITQNTLKKTVSFIPMLKLIKEDWRFRKCAESLMFIQGAFADFKYGLVSGVYHCVNAFLLISGMGGFLGLTIVYTYACSGEVTGLPIDIAWSYTNLWSGMGILIGPFFSGEYS